MRAEALLALQAALTSGGNAALREFPVTAQLLTAVDDGARSRAHTGVAGQSSAADAPGGRCDGAVRQGFQRLAGALLGAALLQMVLADDERADALLAQLRLAPAALGDVGQAEDAGAGPDVPRGPEPPMPLAAAAVEDVCVSSSDSEWEELVACAPSRDGDVGCLAVDPGLALPLAQRVDAKLAWVGGRLRYELVDMPGVWDALGMSTVLLNVLRALRARPRPCAPSLRSLVLRTLCDRWTHALDSTVPVVLDMLAADAASGTEEEAAMPLLVLGHLAAHAAAVAASESDANSLWSVVHASMSSVVAPRAQALAGAVSASPTAAAEVLLQIDPLSAVVSFYAMHGPGGDTIGTCLLQTGVVRSIIALLTSGSGVATAAPLRRAALLACATAPNIASYMAAVPAFTGALQAGRDATGVLWPLVLATAGSPTQAQALAGMLAAATADVTSGNAPHAGAVEVLLLLKDAMSAAGAGRRLWCSGGNVASALHALYQALRTRSGAWASPGSTTAAAELDSSATVASKMQVKCAALLRAVKDVLVMGDGGAAKKD